jgi:hypothetical protein
MPVHLGCLLHVFQAQLASSDRTRHILPDAPQPINFVVLHRINSDSAYLAEPNAGYPINSITAYLAEPDAGYPSRTPLQPL